MVHSRRLGRTLGHLATHPHADPTSAPAPPAAAAAPGGNFTPRRTDDPVKALELLRADGGCIFRAAGPAALPTTDAGYRALAAQLPTTLWGDSLAQIHAPQRLGGGSWDRHRRHWRGWPCGSPDIGNIPNNPHMDKCNGACDLKCDYFAMLCAEAPDSGGGSYLLDAEEMLRSLTPTQRQAMFEIDTVPAGHTGGTPSYRSPMAIRGRRGRLMLALPFGGGPAVAGTAQDTQKPEAGPREGEGRELIETLRGLVRRAATAAPRFRCQPGEALLIDVTAATPFPSSSEALRKRLHRTAGCSTPAIASKARGSCGASGAGPTSGCSDGCLTCASAAATASTAARIGRLCSGRGTRRKASRRSNLGLCAPRITQ